MIRYSIDFDALEVLTKNYNSVESSDGIFLLRVLDSIFNSIFVLSFDWHSDMVD